MPALSNPFRTDSFCCFRQVYISTTQRACRGFKSNILTDTFTSPGATPFFNCSLTRSVYNEFMGDELLCFLIDRNTSGLELIEQLIWPYQTFLLQRKIELLIFELELKHSKCRFFVLWNGRCNTNSWPLNFLKFRSIKKLQTFKIDLNDAFF